MLEMKKTSSLLPVLLLIGLVLIFFWKPLLLPRRILYSPNSDIQRIFLHTKAFPRECLSRYGELPLWNPYLLAGTPFLGNPQSSMFYPLNLPFFFLPAEPLLGWAIALHLAIGAVGIFFLCRHYSLRAPGALTAGVIYPFSQIMVGRIWAGHFATLLEISWLPWLFLSYEKMKKRPIHLLTLAVLIALMFLPGHIQELYYALVVLFFFALYDSVASLKTSRNLAALRPLALLLPAIAIAAGLVAVQALPSLEANAHSLRAGGLSYTEASAAGIPPAQWLTLLSPFAFGPPELEHFFGKWNYWEMATYIGILPLILGVLGVLLNFKRKGIARLTLLAIIAILFSLGHFTPFFKILYNLIPGISLFRIPSRGVFFFNLAFAVLAGCGLESLSRLQKKRKIILIAAILIAALAVGGAVGSGVLTKKFLRAKEISTQRPARMLMRSLSRAEIWAEVSRRAFQNPIFLITSLASAAFLLALASNKLPRNYIFVSALAIILFDLWGYGLPMVRVKKIEDVTVPNKAVKFIKKASPTGRIWDVTGWIMDAEAMRFHLRTIGGYEPTARKHYAKFIQAMLGRKEEIGLYLFPTWNVRSKTIKERVSENLVDLLNVEYLITSEPLEKEGWKEVHSDLVEEEGRYYSLHIYRNIRPHPRAFVVHRARTIAESGNPIEQLRGLQPFEEVLLQKGIPAESFSSPGREEQVRVESDSPNRMVLRVTSGAPGYLVLSEVWMPGWKAVVNGKPAQVLQADVAFRAVRIPKGQSRVVFSYRPVSFTRGIFLSIGTAVGVLIFLFLRAVRRSKACERKG